MKFYAITLSALLFSSSCMLGMMVERARPQDNSSTERVADVEALCTAACNDDGRTIEQLFAQNPRLLVERDSAGLTPLFWAITGSSENAFNLLLRSGVDVNATMSHPSAGNTTFTALTMLISLGETRLLSALLEMDSLKVNVPLNNGSTALHGISALSLQGRQRLGEKGIEDTIKRLCERGADINAQDNQENTPLHWAVEAGNETAIRQLIKNGADKSIKNKRNVTPLMRAAEIGNEAVIRAFFAMESSQYVAEAVKREKEKEVFHLRALLDIVKKKKQSGLEQSIAVDTLEKDREKLMTFVEDLKKRKREERKKRKEAEAEAKKSTEKNAGLTQKIKEFNAQLERLLKRLQDVTEEISALQNRIVQLNREIKDKDGHIADLGRQLVDAKNLLREEREKLTKSQEEIAQLRLQISEADRSNETVRKQLAELDAQLVAARTENTRLKTRIGTLENELRQAQENAQKSLAEVTRLSEEKAREKSEMDALLNGQWARNAVSERLQHDEERIKALEDVAALRTLLRQQEDAKKAERDQAKVKQADEQKKTEEHKKARKDKKARKISQLLESDWAQEAVRERTTR